MIECEHVYKQYKNGTNALYDVNFSVKQGEFVYIIGPTGSGKSTLIKLLDGEELPTKGNVEVVGINVGELKRKQVPIYRRNIGVVFQDFRLLYDRTVEENIEFALRVIEASEREIKTQLKSVLELVGLSGKEKFYPNQLSGGEQQRVALARALATKPPIIIADEPTGNLDPATADEIFNSLMEINARGTTIVVVTHAKDVVNKLNKRVIALDHGKIVKDEQGGSY